MHSCRWQTRNTYRLSTYIPSLSPSISLSLCPLCLNLFLPCLLFLSLISAFSYTVSYWQSVCHFFYITHFFWINTFPIDSLSHAQGPFRRILTPHFIYILLDLFALILIFLFTFPTTPIVGRVNCIWSWVYWRWAAEMWPKCLVIIKT